MATNLDIDQDLLTEAVSIGKHPSKRSAVEAALAEYVARRKQQAVLGMFGSIDYLEHYDPKQARRTACES